MLVDATERAREADVMSRALEKNEERENAWQRWLKVKGDCGGWWWIVVVVVVYSFYVFPKEFCGL